MKYSILVMTALTAALLLGCGKPEAPAAQPGQITDPLVQKMGGPLGLRVTGSSSEDVRYPLQPTGTRSKEEEIVTEGNTIVFRNWIQLKGGPKFLVFSQDALGTPVLRGEFVFEKKNSTNDLKGKLNRQTMQGPSGGMLWIPMSELFPDMTEVYPNEEYLLRMYLDLEGGKSAEFRVAFQASALLPDLAIREEPLNLGPAASASSSLLSGGHPVKVESLTNPSGRALKVWLQAQGHVQVDSVLHHQFFTGNESAPPTGHVRWLIAGNQAELTSVTVQSDGSKSFNLKQPAAFIIPPKRSVTLIWSAALRSESACGWNFSPQERKFDWHKKGSGCGRRGGDGNCDTGGMQTATVHELYSFTGLRLRGEFHRTIYVEEHAPLASPMTSDAKFVAGGNLGIQAQTGHGFDQPHGPGPCASYK